MTRCPVCSGTRLVDTVTRDRLPTMQNYIHRTRESALAAGEATLTLAVCRGCGFAWNRTFDPELLVYDEGYDNAVPSSVMRDYYREIAAYLVRRYDLDGGLVVDVGCGAGAFLRTVCDAAPSARGLGVDPALDRDRSEDGGRIVLRKDVFRPDAVKEAPALIVSRHVLEHIPRPVEFLRAIADAVATFDPSPCFFEVPDLTWIVEHGTFWDFCYEHCNYFTATSFAAALHHAGLEPAARRTAFGDQYLWLEAVTGVQAAAADETGGEALAQRLTEYAGAESARIAAARELLVGRREEGAATAVWGMATKGVLFSTLVDPDASLIDVCVDVNENKQGSYVPLTGHEIRAPEALRGVDQPLFVIVMNDNYRSEIEQACAALGIEATFASL